MPKSLFPEINRFLSWNLPTTAQPTSVDHMGLQGQTPPPPAQLPRPPSYPDPIVSFFSGSYTHFSPTFAQNMRSELEEKVLPYQCDQMAKFFFQYWPFAAMNNCPMAYKNGQSRFKILPSTQYALQELPKTCLKVSPKVLKCCPIVSHCSHPPLPSYVCCWRNYLFSLSEIVTQLLQQRAAV